MAQKRMFDRAVIDTDKFMDLPVSAKALYFLLGMEADDEGFVSYKKVIRIHGGNEDDIKVLEAKNFVIKFNSGVVVITDWRKNNWLDSRRIKSTEYVTEKELLAISKDNQYVLSKRLADVKPEENSIEENRTEQNSISSEQSSQVNKIMDIFYKFNPLTNYGNTTQRRAIQDLLVKFSLDELEAIVKYALSISAEKFAPVITTPLQLKNKMGELIAFKQRADKGAIVTI